MSPSQCPLSLECFRVNEVIDISAGVVTLLFRGRVFAVVGLEEAKGASLTTSPTQLVDGTVNLVVTARFEAFAAPPCRLASAWPETVLGPVVRSIALPTVAILQWAVKGEMVIGLAPKTDLPSFILLWPLLLWFFCLHRLCCRLFLC